MSKESTHVAGILQAVPLALMEKEIEEDLSGSALPLAKEASIQRPDRSSMIKIADLLNLVKWDAAQYVPKRVDVRKLAEDERFDCRFAL